MDAVEIQFVVPGEPKPKARPRFRVVNKKDGGSFVSTYNTSQTEAEEYAIRRFAGLAMAGRSPLTCAVELFVCAYLPIPPSFPKWKLEAIKAGKLFPTKRGDWDNYGKLASDAMNKIVYVDDGQVTTAHVYKRYSDRPRLAIKIKSLGDTPNDLVS